MKVRILPSAWEGLARIKYRVRADFGEDVAQRVTDQILNSLERLEQFPDSGFMTPDPWLNNMGSSLIAFLRFLLGMLKKLRQRHAVQHGQLFLDR